MSEWRIPSERKERHTGRLEDVDFADFDWTDNRQRLISHTETERAHEALVEIQR